MDPDTARYGMTIPFDGVPLHAQRDWIVELEELGYTDVWSAEANGADAFTPLTLSEELAERIDGAALEIMQGCGHVMFLERTAEFNMRIIDFLKGRKQRR